MQNEKNFKAALFEGFRGLAIAVGYEISEERLLIYVQNASSDLRGLDEHGVKEIFKGLVRVCEKFPSYAEFLRWSGIETNTHDQAVLMAGQIIEAISDFGTMQVTEAKAYLGPRAWMAVRKFGGWKDLCMLDYSQLNTARAQLRDICKGVINVDKINPNLITDETQKNVKFGLTELKDALPKVIQSFVGETNE